jgi:peroxiredoxin
VAPCPAAPSSATKLRQAPIRCTQAVTTTSYKLTMTINTSLFFIAIFFSTYLFGQTQNSKFNIAGQVQGFNDGTKIYLNDLSDGSYVKIDSSIISNGKFTFGGQLRTKFLLSSISTVDCSDRVTFWLEKGLTTFKATKGIFNKADIKGSKIQEKFAELNKLRDTLEQTDQIDFTFIKQNPNTIISAHTLSSYCNSWSKDKVSDLYNSFSKEVKLSSYGKKILTFLTLNRNIKIGDKFADFSQKDTTGKLVKLSSIKSNCILLEFWASWCGPCREENPSLVKIYTEFKHKGFEVLAVASETNKQQWTKAIRTDSLIWINVTDFKGSDNNAAMIYGVSGYPSNFLIDKSGVIIAKDIYGDDLRNWLLKIL